MRRFLLHIVPLLLLAACGREPEPVKPADTRRLSLGVTEVAADPEGGVFEIAVDANFEYAVRTEADWISEDGGTPALRRFRSERNPYASPRSATLRFVDVSDRYFFKEVTVTQSVPTSDKVTLSIVDKEATPETKALFARLWTVADQGWLFGHHDDLWYGRYWYNEPGGSDTKAVCGDYPGVFSVDLAEIMDTRYNNAENAIRRRVILEARARGEVILACAHLNNPKTGKDAWDNSSKTVVAEILTEGSATRKTFLSWLDRLAVFMNGLKDADGKLIPVIFRPFHEHTQSWSWWGSSCTGASEFIGLWQLTVTYLRDTKGVHNLLYAISPQMDGIYSDAKERIRFRWPGDDYVDFIGMDCYHGANNDAFTENLKALEAVSLAKRKPCGVTEDGLESFTQKDYWTRFVVNPTEGRRISLVTMWRNKYVGGNESDKHYYSVYPGHPSEEDFRKMYALERTLFSKDLPDMYSMPAGYQVQ